MRLINEYRLRLIGIVVISLLRLGFMVQELVSGSVPVWLVLDNTLIAGIIIWESSRWVVAHTHRRFPIGALSKRRFVWEAGLLLLVTGGLFVVRSAIYLWLYGRANDPTPLVFYLFGLLFTYLYALLVAGFYELLIYMEAWQTSNQEAEQLKKANLMSQLDSLKNQVKPHFLFNSLNTLTALVEKDPQQAVRFIAKLSEVYRYLLQSSEHELISLMGELQFTQAYFFLLQTRFGRGISLSVEGTEPYELHQMPPLTLQMLLENAVKHNQVSVSKPLQVCVTVDEDAWLTVTNNVQQKRTSVPTTGMGLTNIATKYKLLGQPDVQILNTPTHFTVKVPLINPVAS